MGAGKSSLVLRFVKGQFHDYQVRLAFAELIRNSLLIALWRPVSRGLSSMPLVRDKILLLLLWSYCRNLQLGQHF